MNKKYFDALDNVLDRPIAFNPSFKKITGSTNAALLLSQAFYWTKRTNDKDGWFYKTRNEWMEETGLTEAELDGAREKCRAAGVIEEKLKGVPATVHYRVNKPKVYGLLGVQFPENPESGLPPNSQIPQKQESENYGDFNKESENTPKTTTDIKGASLDWKLGHGQEVTQQELDEEKVIEEAPKMFEKVFGFGTLPWSSNSIWEKFRKFVVKIYAADPNVFGDYVRWREDGGKYKAFSNRKIRENPAAFMDTGYPEFEASKMYSKPSTPPQSKHTLTPEQVAQMDWNIR